MTVTVSSDLPLPLFIRGKVRDVFDLGDQLLMVASDRISAFDYVLPTPVPDKGRLLTQISAFWFAQMAPLVANHLISTAFDDFPSAVGDFRSQLDGRTMLVRKSQKLPIECVVRGYLAGSGWKEYQVSQSICGVPLPAGLRESDPLPEPIFTPATKEEMGKHDENISFDRMVSIVGASLAARLCEISLKLYRKAAALANARGLILCDTKFEFGLVKGEVTLIDEILTPDSSRFWDQSTYTPGKSQDSFDKQFVRDYLESIQWNKQPPVPELPEDVVAKTRSKYIDAYERITQMRFPGTV
jgi:phosphoribosylaminoimidazole-succinocarboxamide synthase